MKLQRPPIARRAFTLIEVMVAMLLFFLAVFTILELVSMCLHNARLLQRPTVNTASVASWLSVTNRMSDGLLSGDFREILGEQYRNFEWEAETTELTNGLFVVKFGIIEHTRKGASASAMTTLMYVPGSAGAGRRGGR
jgi:hypothetical protein